MTHRVVAIDQRRRGRRARHRNRRALVEAACLEPAHILRQPEYAVCVRAGEIRFPHQARANGRVLTRQAGGGQRVLDQGADRRDRHTLRNSLIH